MPNLIDVPATLNNCFFHCLAAHHLLNHLVIPDDVFDLKETPFERLSPYVYDKSSFDKIFYNEQQIREGDNLSGDFLVEKILLLGVLFRHYFIKQLKRLDKESAAYQTIQAQFLRDVAALSDLVDDEGDIETLCRAVEDNLGLLLQSNHDYVVAYLEQERGTDVVKDVIEKRPDPQTYFNTEGLRQFIGSLGSDNETLSINDVSLLTQILDIHIERIDEATVVIDSKEAGVRSEIQLDAGHYYLKGDDAEGTRQLNEALTQYRTSREIILREYADRKRQEEAASQSDCLFLAAMLPKADESEGRSAMSNLVSAWEGMMTHQGLSLPLAQTQASTVLYLDSRKKTSFFELEKVVRGQMVEAYFDTHPDIKQKIKDISRRVLEETKTYAMDSVMASIIGEIRDEEAIQALMHTAIKKDLLECQTDADYRAFREKYDFLNAPDLQTLSMLIFFKEMINDREQCLNELITQIDDQLLKKRLRECYQALHEKPLHLSEQLALYQLILTGFSPLNEDEPDIARFETYLLRLKKMGSELEGHHRPILKAVGGLMMAVAFAAVIALSVGSLGAVAGGLAVAGGVLLSLGFFSMGRSKGLARTIEKVAKEGKLASPLSQKLTQLLGHPCVLNHQGNYVIEVDDIVSANRLAILANKHFTGTKMKAISEIDAYHRYCVVMSQVSHEQFDKIPSCTLCPVPMMS